MNQLSHFQIFNIIPSPFFILDIIVMFIFVQQVDNNFITPLVVGESVGLHPMIVMIVLIIGATLIGPIGMFSCYSCSRCIEKFIA